jgi:CxxC motif-containing protein (DUF1111 family)
MRAQTQALWKLFGAASVTALLTGLLSGQAPVAAADPPAKATPAAARIAFGRELFLREWLPNDPRSHGGDGLGPVFNDTSCVACHNQGGPGGGGPSSKNVVVITAVPDTSDAGDLVDRLASALEEMRDARRGEFARHTIAFINGVRLFMGVPLIPVKPEAKVEPRINMRELAKFHPDFQVSRSIILPNFGTEPEFVRWHPVSRIVQAEVDAVIEIELEKPGDQKEETSTAPYEIWRKGDTATSIWVIWKCVENAANDLIEVLALLLEPESILGAGIRPELVALRSLNVKTFETRGRLLGMLMEARAPEINIHDKTKTHASLIDSARNPTALFGAGLIDSIPDAVIEQAAKSRHRGSPLVKGRVSRLRDGRIGKFGWKGQTASLRDFTLTACAIELGLNVPGHEQAVVPYKPEYRSPGFDMNEQECDALVAFVASLPAPAQMQPANEAHAKYLQAGEKLFADIGCAACHLPSLGQVAGIYSDLLLHDMGPALADSGIYGTPLPEFPEDEEPSPAAPTASAAAAKPEGDVAIPHTPPKPRFRGPRRSEWRTPPLWGVRDSGPYLHDGRAETIPDAIAFHGGEALPASNTFFKLRHEQRQQLVSFLKTLTAL